MLAKLEQRRIANRFRERMKNHNKESPPLIVIFGGNGVGKSAFAAMHAAKAMCDRSTMNYCLRKCNERLQEWNEGGYRYSMQSDHLVYSSVSIHKKCFTTRDIDLSRFGLYDKDANPDPFIFPRYSWIFIDEAQRMFDSRNGIPPHVSGFFEIRRHNKYTMYLMCQREKLIDLNIRGLATKLIEVKKMRPYYKGKRLVKTVWECLEFDNCYLIEKYLDSGKDERFGKKVEYVYEGNVFKLYNPEAFELSFHDGCHTKDYEVRHTEKTKRTVEATLGFNSKVFKSSHDKSKKNKDGGNQAV